MPRQPEFEDRVTTSVIVGRQQLIDARVQGINISEVLRRALSRKLRVYGTPAEEAGPVSKISGVPVPLKNKALRHVGVDPRTAATWAGVINKRCNTTLTADDLLELVPRC